jgi:hypothetical protein
MDKENMVYVHNGVLSYHEEEIMSFTGKRMELETIVLSEINQIEKDKCHMSSLMWRI